MVHIFITRVQKKQGYVFGLGGLGGLCELGILFYITHITSTDEDFNNSALPFLFQPHPLIISMDLRQAFSETLYQTILGLSALVNTTFVVY